MTIAFLRIKFNKLSLVSFLFEIALKLTFLVCRSSWMLEHVLNFKTAFNAC